MVNTPEKGCFFMDSTGSFGAASGGISPELQAAMQRRPTSGGATSQVTQGAPGFDPTTQPAQAPTNQAPMGGQTAQATMPSQPNMPFDPAELKMITGSLTNRLKLLGNIQQTMVGIPPKGT